MVEEFICFHARGPCSWPISVAQFSKHFVRLTQRVDVYADTRHLDPIAKTLLCRHTAYENGLMLVQRNAIDKTLVKSQNAIVFL